MKRRQLQLFIQAVIAVSFFTTSFLTRSVHAKDAAPVAFRIERTVMTHGYDGTMCWVHARAGAIPAQDEAAPPAVAVTTQPLNLKGSDVFYALNSSVSRDLGKTWVVASEWMQARGAIPVDNKYGADNSVHIAKIKWQTSENNFTESGQDSSSR